MNCARLVAISIAFILGTVVVRADEPSAKDVAQSPKLRQFLANHCADCHGEDDPEGDVSLVGLTDTTANNVEIWQNVLSQIATGEMPPAGEPKPKPAEWEHAIESIVKSIKHSGFQPHVPGGPLPADGNLIAHDRLFDGYFTGPGYSPPRFWRRSQSQYDALMEELWIVPKLRYEKAHRRTDPKWAGYSYSMPFPTLDPASFTNYSGEVHADEAVLRALIDAGRQIAVRLTSESPAYDKSLQPPVALGIPSIRRGSVWEQFRLDSPARPTEYEPFLQDDKLPSTGQLHAAVNRTFALFLDRKPSKSEGERYGALLQQSIEKRGALPALRGLITAVMVSPEFVFRMEIGMGPKDIHGRRMLSPNELVYAIANALTDDGPDEALWKAAKDGKLQSRADVQREVRRLLNEPTIEKHRKLRFFQEFFGYHRAVNVFKDKGSWLHEVQYLVRDADMLVEHVLSKDRDVFSQLLTIDRYFVAYPHITDPKIFEEIIKHTIQETKTSVERQKQRGREITANKTGTYSRTWAYVQGRTLIPRTVHNDRGHQETSYISVYGFDGNEFNWTDEQPIKVPGRRAGILTHPAWLVAHSTNSDNDVVRRGHWIREHLLAGKIPDVPIAVDAQVPDEPDHSLRHRMRVTRDAQCIRCHRRMDPLGFPFEIYDHYGHFRTQEMVGLRKNMPVDIDPGGAITGSGDPGLDGRVEDAIDLVHKLAQSKRVRQSFVRHAFRFWMGRNEHLRDSPTLLAADKAYVQNEGSFNELLVSLLTSDSFLYRK